MPIRVIAILAESTPVIVVPEDRDDVSAQVSLIEALRIFSNHELKSELREVRLRDRVLLVERIGPFTLLVMADEVPPMMDKILSLVRARLSGLDSSDPLELQTSEELNDLKEDLIRVLELATIYLYLIELSERVPSEGENVRVLKLDFRLRGEAPRVSTYTGRPSLPSALRALDDGDVLRALSEMRKRGLSVDEEFAMYVALSVIASGMTTQCPSIDELRSLVERIEHDELRDFHMHALAAISNRSVREEARALVEKFKRIAEVAQMSIFGRALLASAVYVTVSEILRGLLRADVPDVIKSIALRSLIYEMRHDMKGPMRELLSECERRISSRTPGHEWLLGPAIIMMWHEVVRLWRTRRELTLRKVTEVRRFWRQHAARVPLNSVPVTDYILSTLLGFVIPTLLETKLGAVGSINTAKVLGDVLKHCEVAIKVGMWMACSERPADEILYPALAVLMGMCAAAAAEAGIVYRNLSSLARRLIDATPIHHLTPRELDLLIFGTACVAAFLASAAGDVGIAEQMRECCERALDRVSLEILKLIL